MYSPFKMKGKSPMMKALIGKQNNLPAELKAKIEAAPESPAKMMKKSPAKKMKVKDMPRKQQMAVKASMAEQSPVKMKKAPTKMKKESSMKMKKESSMKMKKKSSMGMTKVAGKTLKTKTIAKKPTDRKEKIAKNIEFNKVARKTGILPNFKTTKEKEKFYSNKANVNMLNKKQKEYFKNKK